MRKTKCSSVKGHLTNKSTASIDNKPPKSINLFIKAKQKKAHLNKVVGKKATQGDKQNEIPSQIEEPGPSSIHHRYHEPDAKLIEDNFLQGGREGNIISPIESFTNIRSRTVPSYKTSAGSLMKRSSTPKYKIEMYAPVTGPPLLKGSIYSKHPSPEKIYQDLQGYPDNDFRNETFPKSRPFDPKIAWSNGTVSYKEQRYSKSIRLDMSMMSLNEQLNHTQSLNKFTNKEIPVYEVDRLQKQEELVAEEQLYLQFIEEVTMDIITRGIFSDRVLKQVFDAHLEKRIGYLNEGRMLAMIEELKRDLNVEEEAKKMSNDDVISYKTRNKKTENARRHNNDSNTTGENKQTELENAVEQNNPTFFYNREITSTGISGDDITTRGRLLNDGLLNIKDKREMGMTMDHNNNGALNLTKDDSQGIGDDSLNIDEEGFNDVELTGGQYRSHRGDLLNHGEYSGNSADYNHDDFVNEAMHPDDNYEDDFENDYQEAEFDEEF